jgi:hypothetical protein
MTTAKQAIRTELRSAAEAREKAEAKLAEIQIREDALKTALAALNGGTAKAKPKTEAKHRRTFRGRESKDERLRQTYDAIRKAGEPVTAADLHREGIPHASALKAIERLLAGGKVKKVGTTTRGNPVVEYIPTTVKPGEPMDQSITLTTKEGS